MQPPTECVTAEELQSVIGRAFAHVEHFELRYTDASQQHIRMTITMRPLSTQGALPVERTGWSAGRATVVFVTGILAQVAMDVGDHYLLGCMRELCRAALDRSERARGEA